MKYIGTSNHTSNKETPLLVTHPKYMYRCECTPPPTTTQRAHLYPVHEIHLVAAQLATLPLGLHGAQRLLQGGAHQAELCAARPTRLALTLLGGSIKEDRDEGKEEFSRAQSRETRATRIVWRRLDRYHRAVLEYTTKIQANTTNTHTVTHLRHLVKIVRSVLGGHEVRHDLLLRPTRLCRQRQ